MEILNIVDAVIFAAKKEEKITATGDYFFLTQKDGEFRLSYNSTKVDDPEVVDAIASMNSEMGDHCDDRFISENGAVTTLLWVR